MRDFEYDPPQKKSRLKNGDDSSVVEEKCPDEPLFALYVANPWRTELTGDGKGTSTFLTSGEEDIDRAFPCLVPVSVKDPERATDLYQARYAIIH